MPMGLTLPFARTTSSLGALAFSSSEVEATHYDLKSLLLTNWGERPNHFDLGCNLIEFLFEPEIEGDLRDRVKSRISDQVNFWMPWIEISQIDVSFPDPDASTMQISLVWRLRKKGTDQNTEVLIKQVA